MINDKFKFIYTQLGKTGSTSLVSALSSIGGKKRRMNHYHLLDDMKANALNYFKFTFVRNPWARCVSRYHFVRGIRNKRTRAYRNSTFDEFVRAKGPPYKKGDNRKFLLTFGWTSHSPNLKRIYKNLHPFENQIDWISDRDGKVLADYVGRTENMQADFDIICDKIGVSRIKLPHKNKSNHKHYTEYYDDETREIVAEKYARDIEYFGYEFGE